MDNETQSEDLLYRQWLANGGEDEINLTNDQIIRFQSRYEKENKSYLK